MDIDDTNAEKTTSNWNENFNHNSKTQRRNRESQCGLDGDVRAVASPKLTDRVVLVVIGCGRQSPVIH